VECDPSVIMQLEQSRLLPHITQPTPKVVSLFKAKAVQGLLPLGLACLISLKFKDFIIHYGLKEGMLIAELMDYLFEGFLVRNGLICEVADIENIAYRAVRELFLKALEDANKPVPVEDDDVVIISDKAGPVVVISDKAGPATLDLIDSDQESNLVDEPPALDNGHEPSSPPASSSLPTLTWHPLPSPPVLPSATPLPSFTPTALPSVTPMSSGTSFRLKPVAPVISVCVTPGVLLLPTVTPTVTPASVMAPTITHVPAVTPTVTHIPAVTPTVTHVPAVKPTRAIAPAVTPARAIAPAVTQSTVNPAILELQKALSTSLAADPAPPFTGLPSNIPDPSPVRGDVSLFSEDCYIETNSEVNGESSNDGGAKKRKQDTETKSTPAHLFQCGIIKVEEDEVVIVQPPGKRRSLTPAIKDGVLLRCEGRECWVSLVKIGLTYATLLTCVTTNLGLEPDRIQSLSSNGLQIISHTQVKALTAGDKVSVVLRGPTEASDFRSFSCSVFSRGILGWLRGFIAKQLKLRDVIPSVRVKNQNPLWVSRWVDYSDKYGLGYELSDKSFGMLFNDNVSLLQTIPSDIYHTIDFRGCKTQHELELPALFKRKLKLLNLFKGYMAKNLVSHAVKPVGQVSAEEVTGYIKYWFRSTEYICFVLNSKTFQVNFFNDHCKLILNREKDFLYFISKERKIVSTTFTRLLSEGITKELYNYLKRLCETVIPSIQAALILNIEEELIPVVVK